jgi:spore germination cell wall hydrolase CwlJ-like protein
MLARLVYLEANTESIECQKAIVSVVINRWQNGTWGDTLEDVIYYPHQFTPASLIAKTTPTQTNYDAVDYVLENGSILPKYVMFFRASYGFSNTDWGNHGYHEYLQVDNTFFGYFEKDK